MIVSCAIRSVIVAVCGVLGVLFTIGLTGIGICGPGPISGWGVVVYLLVSAAVPAMASSFLGRFWLLGGLSFGGAFAMMSYGLLAAQSPKDWNLLALLLGCVALAVSGSWAGHRSKSIGRNET
jgi:hypothetical protein